MPVQRLGAALCLTLLAACGGGGAEPRPTGDPPPKVGLPTGGDLMIAFEDVAASAGVALAHGEIPGPRYWITGQAWGDVDGDGWQDLYLTSSTGPNALHRNRGDGTFEPFPFGDPLRLETHVSGGAVFADYDNDGWKDLYVLGRGANVLFRNLGGAGFEDVTAAAGVADAQGQGETASWGDYDGDGLLDLYVANWQCPDCGAADDAVASLDRLFHQRPDHTFEDVSHLLGDLGRSGLGFVGGWLDYDNDGDPDLYVVNDKGRPGEPDGPLPLFRNVLWRNDGPDPAGWRFTDVTMASGADLRGDCMGLAIGDYDHNGFLDMAFTNIGPLFLLQGVGGGQFADAAASAGVDYSAIHWGTFFADLNLDGWPDLYVAVSSGANLVFLNEADGTFRDVSAESGAADAGASIGCAYADYDRDGWLDVCVGNRDEGYHLYRCLGLTDETLAPPHWLSVRLVGGGPVNRDAIGARVTITRSDGLVQMQEVKSGSSLGAGNDTALHFGLGEASVERLEIRWPDGTTEVRTTVPSDTEVSYTYPP